MVADLSTWDELLKENYSDERIADKITIECPTWAKARKKTNFYGRRKIVPVKYQHNEGIGATVAAAKAAISSTKAKDFAIYRKKQFGLIRLDRELLKVAKVDRYAFLEAADQEADGTENRLVARLCAQLFGGYGGAIGKLDGSCNVATPNLVLDNYLDAIKIKPGMQLEADTVNGGGAVEAGYVTVSAVNEQTGAITLTGNGTAGIGTLTNVMYLFPRGQYDLAPMGFSDFNPTTVPGGADNFCGVNRSVAPVQLSGVRATADGSTVEDALIVWLMNWWKFGHFDAVILDSGHGGTLLRELKARGIYNPSDNSTAKVGFQKLMLSVPVQSGSIEIIIDPYQPNTRAQFVRWDGWAIESADQAPHLQADEKTGYIAFPVDGEDQVEMRLAAYWAPVVYDPTSLGCMIW